MAKTKPNTKVPTTLLYQYLQRIKQLDARMVSNPAQRKLEQAVFKENKKRIIFVCGRKTGKSTGCSKVSARMSALPSKQSYIVGPTKVQQSEILWKPRVLQDIVPPEWNAKEFETDKRLLFPWGSFIKLDGSENFVAGRGLKYDLIIFDEAADQDWRYYEGAYPNLLAKDGCVIITGTIPEHEDNPFVQKIYEAEEDDDWTVIYAPTRDNIMNLPGGEEWLRSERKKYERRGELAFYLREFEAQMVFGGKRSIFPMFSRLNNTRPHEDILEFIKKDRHKLEYYTVCDPGSMTVFAVNFIAYDPYSGRTFILDEIHASDHAETSVGKIWPQIMQKEHELYPQGARVQRIYDSAAAWFANEVIHRYGVGLIPSDKDSRDKQDDISILKDVMEQDWGFIVSNRCYWTIREFSNYQTDDSGKVVKKNDHHIDAIRYFTRLSGLRAKPTATQEFNFNKGRRGKGYLVPIEVDLARDPDNWEQNLITNEVTLDDDFFY